MRTLKCDLEKSIINLGFLAAVLLTCLLCFTAEVYRDGATNQSFSVLESLFRLDRELIKTQYQFASIQVFQRGLSGYLTMFLPIIVAFPFMLSFCAERNSGLMRFTITRSGKWRYYLSKFLSAIIGGGLSVLLGVSLFGICAAVLFPSISSYRINAELLEWIMPRSEMQVVFRMLGTAFLYGALSTLPALFLSSFCKNPYIITCVPFMLNYIRDKGVDKLVLTAMGNGNFDQIDKYSAYSSTAITGFVYADGLTDAMRTTLIFNLCLALVLFIGFAVIMECRKDKGV